MSIEKT